MTGRIYRLLVTKSHKRLKVVENVIRQKNFGPFAQRPVQVDVLTCLFRKKAFGSPTICIMVSDLKFKTSSNKPILYYKLTVFIGIFRTKRQRKIRHAVKL